MYGKAIELLLVNGSADSLTTAELSNWNGKAIKSPRIFMRMMTCYQSNTLIDLQLNNNPFGSFDMSNGKDMITFGVG